MRRRRASLTTDDIQSAVFEVLARLRAELEADLTIASELDDDGEEGEEAPGLRSAIDSLDGIVQTFIRSMHPDSGPSQLPPVRR